MIENQDSSQIRVEKEKQQPEQQNQKQRSSSNKSQSSDSDKYYNQQDDSSFNALKSKPFDLKALWLGNTDDMIKKFQQKLTEVKIQKDTLKKGFQLFSQNEQKYKKSSLRKITFNFDKKKIYQEFMQKSRRPIEKLHTGLLLNIGSYIDNNLFYFLAKMRRVSKIFNFIYKSQQVTIFLSQKDLGSKQNRKYMEKISYEWLSFQKTFLYYKQIKYTNQIPPNSFKNDLQNAVNFINQIHKRIFKTKNFQIGYFKWINKFMKIHRIVIALSTLSLTNLIMIRKPSIVAFSNYLALNPSQRKKQQITKTKYHQVIKIVQDEDYRDCLIINTKVSNYLSDEYEYDFSVFIIHSLTGKTEPSESFLDQLYTYNVLFFHKHNDQKSKFVRNVQLSQGNVLDTDAGICVRFNQKNIQSCQFSITTENDFKTMELKGSFMNCLIRDYENQIKFSECYVYNEQYHYLIIIKNLLQNMPFINESEQNS